MPVGVLVTVITLVVVVPVLLMVRRVLGGLSRQQAETRRLLAVGVPAPAQVLGTQMGGMTVTTGVHRHLQLVLQLQVQPYGRPPYAAQLTTLVSELQVPQLQPGATVQVRIDPADPAKLALEGVGTGAMPGPAASPPSPYGAAPPMQQYGAPRMQYGAGPAAAPGMIPVQPVTMPAGAKVGMVLGIVGALVGVGVSIWVSTMQVETSPTMPGASPPAAASHQASELCQQAVRCCSTVAGGSATHCEGLGAAGVTDDACRSALDGFARAAEASGKHCE